MSKTISADDSRRSGEFEKQLEPVITESAGSASFDEHVAIIEARWATGFDRPGDGRHVSDIGPVSRRGYRKVFPAEGMDDFEREFKTERVIEAAKVLHGRNASIFEGYVIARLTGERQRSIPELAAQFGITDKQVYKIIARCMQRVRDEMEAAKGRPGQIVRIVSIGKIQEYDGAEKAGKITPLPGRKFDVEVVNSGLFYANSYGNGLMALWRIFRW